MSATRSQVVFSRSSACGVLLPQPRWSKSMTCQRRGIEVAAVVGVEAAARAAVEEHGLLALRVADLLVVDGVEVRDLQDPVRKGSTGG